MHGMVAYFRQMFHSIRVHKKFAKEYGYLFIITYDYNHLYVDVHTFVNIRILLLNLNKTMTTLIVLMDVTLKKS
jgi:plasmid replication initiation protein